MHSVFKTNHLSKEKIEEMATYCMAKFWNIDTFIDHEIGLPEKNPKKKADSGFRSRTNTKFGFHGK